MPVSFLIKLEAWDCNFIKKEALAKVISCEFFKISKNTFSYQTPPVSASVISFKIISPGQFSYLVSIALMIDLSTMKPTDIHRCLLKKRSKDKIIGSIIVILFPFVYLENMFKMQQKGYLTLNLQSTG